MARNTLKLDTSGFDAVLQRLDSLGGDTHAAVEEVLTEAAQKVHDDTVAAIAKPNLPRQGMYSDGQTMESIVTDTTPRWDGDVGWVPVGFDFSRPGAGGYLIKGRGQPTAMRRVQALYQIYEGKKYMTDLQTQMLNKLWDEVISKSLEG